jgi:hypothetical protein
MTDSHERKPVSKPDLANMDKKTLGVIKQTLSNNEEDSNEEIRQYFIEEVGLTPEQADYWLTKRDFYRLNIVMEDEDGNEIGIFNPHTVSIDPLPEEN